MSLARQHHPRRGLVLLKGRNPKPSPVKHESSHIARPGTIVKWLFSHQTSRAACQGTADGIIQLLTKLRACTLWSTFYA